MQLTALDRDRVNAMSNILLLLAGVKAQFILSASSHFSYQERKIAVIHLTPNEVQ